MVQSFRRLTRYRQEGSEVLIVVIMLLGHLLKVSSVLTFDDSDDSINNCD
jgi:hypothetical protein